MKNEIKNIYEEIFNIQHDIGILHNSSENPAFNSRYLNLADLVKEIKPALLKHGVAYVQLPLCNDTHAGCKTILTHLASNTSVESELLLPLSKRQKNIYANGVKTVTYADPDAQIAGSCISYAKRYALASMLGVVSSNEDDDGNEASQQDAQPAPQVEKPQATKNYNLKTKNAGINKTSVKDDEIPAFGDSQQIVVKYKYDVTKVSSDEKKFNALKKYVEASNNGAYVHLDEKTCIVESEIELKMLEKYKI